MDLSSAMIAQAIDNLGQNHGIRFMHADAEKLADELTTKFDLIVSNAMIQWFTQPLLSMRKYADLLSSTGQMYFSTFGPKTFQELRQAFYVAEKCLGLPDAARVLNFNSMKHWSSVFDDCDNLSLDIEQVEHTQYFRSVTEFIQSVKKAGATSAYTGSTAAMGKNLYRSMLKEYETRFSQDGSHGIPATYHIFYLHVSRLLTC